MIAVAILNYQAEYHQWPVDVNRGKIPPGLGPYLPDGMTFNPPDYVVDYDDWSNKSGSSAFVGLTIISDDEALGQEIVDMLGGNAWTNGSDRFTRVIEWAN